MDQWVENNGEAGGFFGNDPSTQSDTTKVIKRQFLCPVTARQIHTASDKGVEIGSRRVTMVSLCGVVTHKKQTSTKIKFILNDSTGSVNCMEWVETLDHEQKFKHDIKVGQYHRIYGSLRFEEGQKKIVVFRMHRLKKLNELTAFMLEVMNAKEHASNQANQASKEWRPTASKESDVMDSGPLSSAILSLRNKMTPIQSAILHAIAAVKNPVGWSRFDPKVTNKYSEREILDTLEKLVSEGHIYTTIDDDHYSST